MRHHHTAQGLASLGRHGDTMLVHMSPEEVHGLDALARMQGTKLTRNPETGMPEAFSLGGFLGGLLPTIGGIAASAMFPEASPWLIGTIAGVGTTLATGNPLAGIMTGLGVGGGMGIGKGIFNVGDKLAESAGSQVAQSVAQNEAAKLSSAAAAGQNISPYTTQAATYTGATSPYTNAAFNTATMQAPMSAVVGQNLNTFGAGLKESFSNPAALVKELGGGTNAAFKLGTPVLGAAMKGVEPKDYLGYDPNAPAPEQKKIDITKPLNLEYDSGLRLFATGGNVSNQYTASSGISDLYSSPDGAATPNLSQDGYGIGRLASLARQQSMSQAQSTGYAQGGYLDGQGDGMSDSIPATIEGKQPARLADGEFVVPADVVSHLGNGSSKAGSKRLYAMLHKVRKARTGNPKQGKQINPDSYLPA